MPDLLADILVHYVFPNLAYTGRETIQSCSRVNKLWRSSMRTFLKRNPSLIERNFLIRVEDTPTHRYLFDLINQYIPKVNRSLGSYGITCGLTRVGDYFFEYPYLIRIDCWEWINGYILHEYNHIYLVSFKPTAVILTCYSPPKSGSIFEHAHKVIKQILAECLHDHSRGQHVEITSYGTGN